MAKETRIESCPLDFPSILDLNDNPPTEEEISKVADYPVFNIDGQQVPFRSLYENTTEEKKTHKKLIIFVRHFFCGSCQDFLEHISRYLPSPAELAALQTPASIAIVGCGQSSLIPFYIETTKCKFSVFADPTRYLYSVLGMMQDNVAPAQKPDYRREFGDLQGFMRAAPQAISRISHGDSLKGGDHRQVGGDFLFENGKVTWCHRMRNVDDHTDLAKIRKLLRLPPLEQQLDGLPPLKIMPDVLAGFQATWLVGLILSLLGLAYSIVLYRN